MADAMLFRSVERVVVGIPQSSAENLHVARAHGVAQVRRKFKEAANHVLHDLFASSKFTMRGVQDDFGVDTVLEFFGLALLEVVDARTHGFFHFAVDLVRIGWDGTERGDLALEVNSDGHLVEQVHAQNAVDGAAAGVSDGTKVDSGKLEVSQMMIADGEFGHRDLTRAGRGGSRPGGHLNLFDFAARERFQVEHGGGAGIQEKTKFRAADVRSNDGEAIATLNGDLIR